MCNLFRRFDYSGTANRIAAVGQKCFGEKFS